MGVVASDKFILLNKLSENIAIPLAYMPLVEPIIVTLSK